MKVLFVGFAVPDATMEEISQRLGKFHSGQRLPQVSEDIFRASEMETSGRGERRPDAFRECDPNKAPLTVVLFHRFNFSLAVEKQEIWKQEYPGVCVSQPSCSGCVDGIADLRGEGDPDFTGSARLFGYREPPGVDPEDGESTGYPVDALDDQEIRRARGRIQAYRGRSRHRGCSIYCRR